MTEITPVPVNKWQCVRDAGRSLGGMTHEEATKRLLKYLALQYKLLLYSLSKCSEAETERAKGRVEEIANLYKLVSGKDIVEVLTK